MKIKKTKSFLLTCLLSFAMCSIFTAKTFGQGGTLRVDSTSTAGPNEDGETWATAFSTLWAALDSVNNVLGLWEIWVAQGTYTPVLKDAPFIIDGKDGEEAGDRIVLLGGYAGLQVLPGDPNQRDPKLYPTILSGDILGASSQFGIDSDFGNRNVNPDNWHDETRLDNARTVLFVSNSGRGNRIEGFTIQGGTLGTRIIENQPYNVGGGIIIKDSAIDIVNCTFRFNSAGEVPAEEGEPVFGRVGEGGAAIVIGSWEITPGVYDYTRFINCIFHDNLAARGGALALVDGSLRFRPTQVKVVNSLFYDNQALIYHGLLFDEFDGKGGAIAVNGNNPFVGDDEFGNAFANRDAFIEVTNCTIVNNFAQKSTGGLRVANIATAFYSHVQNSVFWGNCESGCSTSGSQIQRKGSGSNPANIKVTFTDVDGGLTESTQWPFWVEDVIDEDPLFVDADNKDFRVPQTSPLVEAADPLTLTNSLIPVDEFDLDDDGDSGELTPGLDLRLREFDSDNDGTAQVDMGMFEFTKCCADVASASLDYVVNVTDLLALLAAWGPNPG